jgi:hypothetical protein
MTSTTGDHEHPPALATTVLLLLVGLLVVGASPSSRPADSLNAVWFGHGAAEVKYFGRSSMTSCLNVQPSDLELGAQLSACMTHA